MKSRDHFGYLVADGWIILKGILKKQDVMVLAESRGRLL
jgi:hypothetical protein